MRAVVAVTMGTRTVMSAAETGAARTSLEARSFKGLRLVAVDEGTKEFEEGMVSVESVCHVFSRSSSIGRGYCKLMRR